MSIKTISGVIFDCVINIYSSDPVQCATIIIYYLVVLEVELDILLVGNL